MVTAKHDLETIVGVIGLQAGSSIVNPNITEYDGNQLVWQLRAKLAVEEDDMVKLTQPWIDVFMHNNEKAAVVADQGWYDKKKSMMHFTGDVSLAFQGWVFTSAALDFDKDKDQIHVVGAFEMKQKGTHIQGKNMVLHRKTGNIRVLQGVRMVVEQAK